ncbi:MAG: TIGR01777 family oxidoreductase [Thermodesulfovibrionales bacterium]|nr:TIGR01777 family oxidoreductase [Thermodesulfovibrionales bacterium]
MLISQNKSMEIPSLKISISGASGFVGGNLIKRFKALNWQITAIEKSDFQKGKDRISSLISDSDAVINLAGAPIIAKWTEEYKKVMIASRVQTTRMIVDCMAISSNKPKVFISTSAIGIYSANGTHTENDFTYANDFLGDLAKQWESEALRATEFDIRTVIFRFGIVLGNNGGALQQMLPPFKLGLGGTIGDGSQAFSWIHIEDLVNAYIRAISDKHFTGIYNLTAPEPTTNKGLTLALSQALKKPAFFKIPEFALKLKYGEGAQALIKGQRVIPERLLKSGFIFKFPEINTAIRDIVSNS